MDPKKVLGRFQIPREVPETPKCSWEVPDRRQTQKVLETPKEPKKVPDIRKLRRTPKTTVFLTRSVARNGLRRGF